MKVEWSGVKPATCGSQVQCLPMTHESQVQHPPMTCGSQVQRPDIITPHSTANS